MNTDAPADEDGCGKTGKAFAATAAGWMGPGIVANHHTSIFKVSETLLQVATETLSKKIDAAKGKMK